MVKKHRFLSALMLAVCLSASFFMPSKVNAYGLSCWYDDCKEVTEDHIKIIARQELSRTGQIPNRIFSRHGGLYIIHTDSDDHKSLIYNDDESKVLEIEEYSSQLGRTNCEQCAKNISAINSYVQDHWQSLCREANDFDNLSAKSQESAMALCEVRKKQMAEDTANRLACSDQEEKNVQGMSKAIMSAGVATLGVVLMFTPVAPVGAVLTVAGAIGAWLFGRQVSSETETFGAKFTEILNTFMGDNNGCWFCSSFDILFDNINNIATHMYDELRSLFLALLAIFTMAWLLWTVFKFITTIHGPNVGELMTKLFKGLGAAMLIAIVLRAPPYFITQYIVDPFATIGTELSAEILRAQGMETGTVEYTAYSLDNGGYHCGKVTIGPEVIVKTATSNTETKTICETVRDDDERFKEKALSAGVYSGMSCLLKSISIELIFGLALGATFISEGIRGGFGSVLPQFDVLSVGIIIFLSYFILFLKVPCKLIDLLLRIGFVIILLPLFIVCMVTPATRGYSKKAWDMLLGCWISLIALCLVVSLTIVLMGDTLMKDVDK